MDKFVWSTTVTKLLEWLPSNHSPVCVCVCGTSLHWLYCVGFWMFLFWLFFTEAFALSLLRVTGVRVIHCKQKERMVVIVDSDTDDDVIMTYNGATTNANKVAGLMHIGVYVLSFLFHSQSNDDWVEVTTGMWNLAHVDLSTVEHIDHYPPCRLCKDTTAHSRWPFDPTMCLHLIVLRRQSIFVLLSSLVSMCRRLSWFCLQ